MISNLIPTEMLYHFFKIIAWYFRALLQKKGENLYLLDYFTAGVILNETTEWMLKKKLQKVRDNIYIS